MKGFWQKADRIWNENRFVASLLIVVGFAFTLWTIFCPQSPGVSIGLLATAAGIISVRPKMQPVEKFAWVAILVVLSTLEVKAIYRSDRENAAKNQSILDDMTGGSSFLVITPQAMPSSSTTGAFLLMVFNVGSQTVWDARIEMSDGPVTSGIYFDPTKKKVFPARSYSNTFAQGLDESIHPLKGQDNVYTF